MSLTDCRPLITLTHQMQSVFVLIYDSRVEGDSADYVLKRRGLCRFTIFFIYLSSCIIMFLCLASFKGAFSISVPSVRYSSAKTVREGLHSYVCVRGGSRTSVCRQRPAALQCRLHEASKLRWNMQEGEFITKSVTSCLPMIHHHSLVDIL